MGNKTLIYKQKMIDNLKECKLHLDRLSSAFDELEARYSFPIDKASFDDILKNTQYLAYSDQVIYRFSKLQDSMGAKLFKSFFIYLGENTNKPFLDMLNRLEAMGILDVDEWFEMRDLRDEIAHEYETDETVVVEVLNMIYKLRDEFKQIFSNIEKVL